MCASAVRFGVAVPGKLAVRLCVCVRRWLPLPPNLGTLPEGWRCVQNRPAGRRPSQLFRRRVAPQWLSERGVGGLARVTELRGHCCPSPFPHPPTTEQTLTSKRRCGKELPLNETGSCQRPLTSSLASARRRPRQPTAPRPQRPQARVSAPSRDLEPQQPPAVLPEA